jgi:MFS family permease
MNFQIAGILLTALSASIYKPLMTQFAARITNETEARRLINNRVTLLNYCGILLGYVLSGVTITYFGFSTCFFANAVCFALFITLVMMTRFSAQTGEALDSQGSSYASDSGVERLRGITANSWEILGVFALSICLAITVGSINVLEVAFAKEFMNATELQISNLFFFAASGAILFSLISERNKVAVSSWRLGIVSILAGVAIVLYVAIAKVYWVAPFLALYGYAIAYHGYLAMCLVQENSTAALLTRNSVILNVINQGFTLLSAAAGVLVSDYIGTRYASLVFAAVTVASGFWFLLFKRFTHLQVTLNRR